MGHLPAATDGEQDFLYGINPAFEVLRAGRREIIRAYLADLANPSARVKKLSLLLERRGVPIQKADRTTLSRLSVSQDHQGVVITAGPFPYTDARKLFFQGRRLLLLDNVEDPQNVGAILRSAEVFGFHSVLLARKGVPGVYPSVVKASAGAVEWLQVSREMTASKVAGMAAKNGFHTVALDRRGHTPVESFASTRLPESKLLLIVGGEDRSVGQYILNTADTVVRIEQRGRISSLNASVAAGIAMHALSNVDHD